MVPCPLGELLCVWFCLLVSLLASSLLLSYAFMVTQHDPSLQSPTTMLEHMLVGSILSLANYLFSPDYVCCNLALPGNYQVLAGLC